MSLLQLLQYINGNGSMFCTAVKFIDVFKALFIFIYIYLLPPSLLPFPTLLFPFLPSFLARSFRPFISPVLPYLLLTSLLTSPPLVGWLCYDSQSTAKDPDTGNNSYYLFEVSP